MKYHLMVAAPNGAQAYGPLEFDTLPGLNTIISETFEGRQLVLKVVGYQQLPIVPSGIMKHDETWLMCEIVGGDPFEE